MGNVRIKNLAMLVVVLTWSFSSPAVWAQQVKPVLTVRYGKVARTYTHDQLLALATGTLPNMKGTRKKPAIPFETILFKDTGITRDKVERVFLIGKKSTILRGNDLAYLNRLVLATGPDKDGKPHMWALAPTDEETYKVVRAHMGSRRKGGIYRIDIHLKGNVE
jgi:hypothetical protein